MLELQKLVLQNVSDDKNLFKKEIIKSFRWLKFYEIHQLHQWLKENYWNTHQEEITEAFWFIAA